MQSLISYSVFHNIQIHQYRLLELIKQLLLKPNSNCTLSNLVRYSQWGALLDIHNTVSIFKKSNIFKEAQTLQYIFKLKSNIHRLLPNHSITIYAAQHPEYHTDLAIFKIKLSKKPNKQTFKLFLFENYNIDYLNAIIQEIIPLSSQLSINEDIDHEEKRLKASTIWKDFLQTATQTNLNN